MVWFNGLRLVWLWGDMVVCLPGKPTITTDALVVWLVCLLIWFCWVGLVVNLCLSMVWTSGLWQLVRRPRLAKCSFQGGKGFYVGVCKKKIELLFGKLMLTSNSMFKGDTKKAAISVVCLIIWYTGSVICLEIWYTGSMHIGNLVVVCLVIWYRGSKHACCCLKDSVWTDGANMSIIPSQSLLTLVAGDGNGYK